jgi:hypothetical protein
LVVGPANQENAIRQRLVANVIGESALRSKGGAAIHSAFYLGLVSVLVKTFSRENKPIRMKLKYQSVPGENLVDLFDRSRG